LETLIATSLLMGLVLLLRRPVARMFGAQAAYALWLAPLVRLLLPPMPIRLPAPIAHPGADLVVLQGGHAAPLISMSQILIALWSVGAIAFLLWHILCYRRFLADALLRGRAIATACIDDAAVIATPAVTGPAAAGLLVRRIFVPRDFDLRFSPEEQRLALAHEALHHRRGDLWAGAAALLMLAVHWFNPLAHMAHRYFRRDLESACDASLLRRFGGETRPAYARTILRCAGQPMPQTICALTPIGELKGRLEMLKLHHGQASRLAGAAFASVLAGGGLLIAQPVAAQEKSGPTDRIEVRRMVIDGKEGPDQVRRALGEDLSAKLAQCDGEKFEADTSRAPGADGKPERARTRMFVCAKGGSTKAEAAAALEKVLSRIEGTNEMPAENKAQIVARLKARIAELKAGS
jgi:beta-lactamase regulating signal transducer with metallopeptidase domain